MKGRSHNRVQYTQKKQGRVTEMDIRLMHIIVAKSGPIKHTLHIQCCRGFFWCSQYISDVVHGHTGVVRFIGIGWIVNGELRDGAVCGHLIRRNYHIPEGGKGHVGPSLHPCDGGRRDTEGLTGKEDEIHRGAVHNDLRRKDGCVWRICGKDRNALASLCNNACRGMTSNRMWHSKPAYNMHVASAGCDSWFCAWSTLLSAFNPCPFPTSTSLLGLPPGQFSLVILPPDHSLC